MDILEQIQVFFNSETFQTILGIITAVASSFALVYSSIAKMKTSRQESALAENSTNTLSVLGKLDKIDDVENLVNGLIEVNSVMIANSNIGADKKQQAINILTNIGTKTETITEIKDSIIEDAKETENKLGNIIESLTKTKL